MKPNYISLAAALCVFSTQAEQLNLSKLPIQIAGPTAYIDQQLGWRFAAGIGAEVEAQYHGSKKQATEPDLYVEAAYRAKKWEFQSNLLSNKLFYQASENITTLTWLNHEEGRDMSDATDNTLAGMGNIESALELGGGLNWHINSRLNLGLYGQTYLSGKPDKGHVGFVTMHYKLIQDDFYTLEFNADVSFANSDHMQTEFGITDKQANTTKYSAYQLSSGVKSYGIGLSVLYLPNPSWLINISADYEKYSGKVSNSPLIKAGSDTEIEAGLTIVYKF